MVNKIYHLDNKPRELLALPAMPAVLASQKQDAETMVNAKRFCLFNKPGTGKTITTLLAWAKLHKNRAPIPRMCVVVPSIAVTNWVEWTLSVAEAHKIQPRIQVIRSSKAIITSGAYDVIITTYGLMSRSNSKIAADLSRKFDPEIVVLDESHNLSNPDAHRTKAVFQTLIKRADYIWALTGTPIRRFADDLWPTLFYMFPEIAKRHNVAKLYQFRSRFCEVQKVKIGGRVVDRTIGSKNVSALRRIFFNKEEPIAVARDFEAYELDVPRFRVVDIDYKNSDKLKELTKKASQTYFDADMQAAEMNPAISECLHELGVAKTLGVADYVAELLKEIKETGVLVLFWHRKVGKLLLDIYPQAAYIDGATSDRDKQVKAFTSGETNIMLGQISTMGVALNLQANCRNVVFAERSWSASDNEQAYKRVWRRGQQYPVQIDYCLADHPMDHSVSSLLLRKSEAKQEMDNG